MNRINEEWKQENGKYKCPFCKEEKTKIGITTHIWRKHGEGKIHNPNIGFVTKNRKQWNKNLTKETSEVLKKQAERTKEKYKNGQITPGFKNKKHTKETKKIISEKLSKNNKGGRCKWFEVKKKNGEVIKVQGTWEVRFANVLSEIDEMWLKPSLYHTKHSFKWIDKTGKEHTYTPDFYSPKLDKYFEVKGYWWGNDKEKMECVHQQNEIVIEIVMKKELVIYEKLMGKLV